jgi:hypothetical protein
MSICIKIGSLLTVITFCLMFNGCQPAEKRGIDRPQIDVKEVTTFEELQQNANHLLGLPIRLKFDHTSEHLFIQDPANSAVFEYDDEGEVLMTYGREGRGPGEVQFLSDFFVTQNHLFIVDSEQLLIHKFSRHDGQFISSLDYQKHMSETLSSSNLDTPPVPLPTFIDNNNKPFVTHNETVLLPTQTAGQFLYQLVNWDGEKIADVGEMPKECNAAEDNDDIRRAILDEKVPGSHACLAFPVSDITNSEEIFIIYSTSRRIAKYNLSGDKLWEKPIVSTPEVDSLAIDFREMVRSRPGYSNTLLSSQYVSGRSAPGGELYLTTYTNVHTPVYLRPMWIHQFNNDGELNTRYKIVSEDGYLYYPAIDNNGKRIFASAVNTADVRIYQY